MKKTIAMMMASMGVAVLLSACKEKKEVKDTAEYAESYEIPQPSAPVSLEQPPLHVAAKWEGVPCQISVTCQSVDSLGMVYNEFGQAYKDNAFDLRIQKADGTMLFSRRLTKQMFLPKIKEERDRTLYSEKAVLRSVSAEVNEDGVFQYFNVSLQMPEAVDDDNILFHLYTNGTCEQEEIDYMYETAEEGV